MKLTQDQIDTIIELHAMWWSDRSIAETLWHSRGTVIRYTDSIYLADRLETDLIELKIQKWKLEDEIESYHYFHKFILSATLSFLAIAILFNFI